MKSKLKVFITVAVLLLIVFIVAALFVEYHWFGTSLPSGSGDWLGFWGTIISGVIGAIVAALISYYITTTTFLRLETQKIVVTENFQKNKQLIQRLVMTKLQQKKQNFENVEMDVNKLKKLNIKSANLTAKECNNQLDQIQSIYDNLAKELGVILNSMRKILEETNNNQVILNQQSSNFISQITSICAEVPANSILLGTNRIKFSMKILSLKTEYYKNNFIQHNPVSNFNASVQKYIDEMDEHFVNEYREYLDDLVIPIVTDQVVIKGIDKMLSNYQNIDIILA